MGIETIISTLAHTDFKTHTIRPVGQEGIEIVEKDKSLWGGRSFDYNNFNKALDNLLALVRSHPEDFEKQALVSDLYDLADKLFAESKDIKTNALQVHAIQQKINNLVTVVLFQKWEHSNQSLRESIEQFTTREDEKVETAWRDVFRSGFITEEDDLFLFDSLLGVSVEFWKNQTDEQAKKTLKKAIAKHPEISTIRVQGGHSFSLTEFKEILKNQTLPISTLFTPVYVTGVGSQSKLLLHPAFIRQSQYLRSMLAYNRIEEERAGELGEPFIEINHDVLSEINIHCPNGFSTLAIHSDNVMELYWAADYLQIPSLKDKCEKFLETEFNRQMEGLNENELWEFAVEWASAIAPLRNDTVQELLKKGILETDDISVISRRLADLKEKNISFKSLNINLDSIVENQIQRLSTEKKWELALEWSSLVAPEKNDSINNLFSHVITKINNFEDLITKLTVLKETGVELQDLHLSIALNNDELKTVLSLCPSISSLTFLGGTQITDEIGPSLINLPNLRSLCFHFCYAISDAIGTDLVQLKQLETLEFSSCSIPDKIGLVLERLPKLQNLTLSSCHSLTDAIGIALGKLTQLKTLNISHNRRLMDGTLFHMAKLVQLQELNISYCDFSDGVDYVLSKFTQLKTLKARGCKFTNGIGFALAKLVQLETLDLGYTKISDKIGKYLIKLSFLKHLDLTGCEKISGEICHDLIKLPRLQSLKVIGIYGFESYIKIYKNLQTIRNILIK